MVRSQVSVLCVFSLCAFALTAAPASAQISHLPALGTPVPAALLSNAKHEKQCRTSDHHYDPCIEVDIGKIRYTVAWDTATKAITYLYTDDHDLVTDSGLAVGNSIRVVGDSGQADPTVGYMKWVIDPRWKDTDAKLGNNSVWYAALRHDGFDRNYANIVGFVQSRYIDLKH